MNKYIGKRFLQLIPVLLGITFLSFAMMRAAGSDAIIELYGDKGAVAQEIIDAKRASAMFPGRTCSGRLCPSSRRRCC